MEYSNRDKIIISFFTELYLAYCYFSSKGKSSLPTIHHCTGTSCWGIPYLLRVLPIPSFLALSPFSSHFSLPALDTTLGIRSSPAVSTATENQSDVQQDNQPELH